jgi:hypothetical protein
MTLVPLTVLVPLVAAGLLGATRPLGSRLMADVVALAVTLAVQGGELLAGRRLGFA